MVSLKRMLELLPAGKEVSVEKIASKLGVAVPQAEEMIAEVLSTFPGLGSLDVFEVTFKRSEPSPQFDMPTNAGNDDDLGRILADGVKYLDDRYSTWLTEDDMDDIFKKAEASEMLVREADKILAIVEKVYGIFEGKSFDDIDVSLLDDDMRAAIKKAFSILLVKRLDGKRGIGCFGNATLWYKTGRLSQKLK
ncbi:MAG: hypothetical protein ACTSWN_05790 [Promethearchaeota archaeon]